MFTKLCRSACRWVVLQFPPRVTSVCYCTPFQTINLKTKSGKVLLVGVRSPVPILAFPKPIVGSLETLARRGSGACPSSSRHDALLDLPSRPVDRPIGESLGRIERTRTQYLPARHVHRTMPPQGHVSFRGCPRRQPILTCPCSGGLPPSWPREGPRVSQRSAFTLPRPDPGGMGDKIWGVLKMPFPTSHHVDWKIARARSRSSRGADGLCARPWKRPGMEQTASSFS